MNRFKKEELRKRREAREGKTPEEIEAMDREEELQEKIDRLTRELHAEWFPEEYDYRYDDAMDRADRRQGINPMKQEYIDEVQAKREKQGVPPLSANGTTAGRESWQKAREEADRRVRNGDNDGS